MEYHPNTQALWEWVRAWPRAKAAVIEVDVEVRRSARPWAEVWTRAQAQAPSAWAEARAAEARALEKRGVTTWRTVRHANAEEEALALAGAWAWARTGARAGGQGVPAILANSSRIRNILSFLNRNGVAHNLWHRSDTSDTRDEYSSLIHFITPIAGLPPELLIQIFLIIIDEARGSPLVLMLVCKSWHAIVSGIWAALNLGTRTPMNVVARKLERNQWLLDIVVDTDSDRGDFTPSDGAFEPIFAAIEASSRWRSLIVESFPAQADLPQTLVKRGLKRSSDAAMSRFTTFKVKSACETSPLLSCTLSAQRPERLPQWKSIQQMSYHFLLLLTPPYSIPSKSSLSILRVYPIQSTFYLIYINWKHLLPLISHFLSTNMTLTYHSSTHSVISVSELSQFSG